MRLRKQVGIEKEWMKHFYIVRINFNDVLKLWVISWKHDKKRVSGVGGFINRSSAQNWIGFEWKRLLEQKIEETLLQK